MESINEIFTSFGLAGPAGLNAYLTLLIVALAGRFPQGHPFLTLNPSYGPTLTSTPIIIVLLVLVGVETFADKIPGVDHINDIISTVIRPVAGAIAFAASNHTITNVHPALALACGFIVAGGVHATKAGSRPLVTLTTAGIGNPIISTIEDVLAVAIAVMAIALPLVGAAFALFLFFVGVIIFLRLRARRRRKSIL